MTRTTPQAAAIYCRLSQDRNGESLGIERQEKLCRKLAAEKGWTVAEVFTDRDISAYSGRRRPGYERMVDDLKNELRDAVIVVDQDRLTRAPKELESFIDLADQHGIALATVSGEVDLSTSDGRFRARIMGTVARQESEKKSERQKRQRDQAARLGKFQGGPRRYGYEPDGKTIRKSEAKVIKDIARRLLKGDSMRSIVLDLNAQGVPSANGGPWHGSHMKRLMTSPRLAGLRVHNGEEVAEAEWKPILDRNTFERLRALLVTGKQASPRGRPPTTLLGGIARCERCGGPLHKAKHHDKRVYRCSTPGRSRSCSGVSVQGDDLDDFIEQVILHRISTKAVAGALARPTKNQAAKEEIEDLAQIDLDLEALAADFGRGRISRREWLAARDPLEERRRAAVVDLERETETFDAAAHLAASADVPMAWQSATADRRRQIVRDLTDKITVGPVRRPGSRDFDPDRVDIVWKV